MDDCNSKLLALPQRTYRHNRSGETLTKKQLNKEETKPRDVSRDAIGPLSYIVGCTTSESRPITGERIKPPPVLTSGATERIKLSGPSKNLFQSNAERIKPALANQSSRLKPPPLSTNELKTCDVITSTSEQSKPSLVRLKGSTVSSEGMEGNNGTEGGSAKTTGGKDMDWSDDSPKAKKFKSSAITWP
jgi:hypothetical protein